MVETKESGHDKLQVVGRKDHKVGNGYDSDIDIKEVEE
jgi:hypothetical protein